MTLSIVRLGSPRRKANELRLGTVRRPPRGVPKKDYSRLNYYDVWLPLLSPSMELVKKAKRIKDEKAWKGYERQFKAEMKKPEAAHILELIAALSHRMDLSIGCYCADEQRCHRSILKKLLKQYGAKILNA